MPTEVSALPVGKQEVGIAKEVTKGTWVTPSTSIVFDSFTPEDKITELPVQGYQGIMAEDLGMVPGIGVSDLSGGGPVYPDTIGWFLGGVLGDLVTTGASAPYTNTFSLLNSGTGQPTSHSITHNYNATESRAYAGIQWNSLEITFTAPDLAKFTVKGTGFLSAQQATPTFSFTTVLPFAAWQCVAKINAATTVAVTQATVTISRKEDTVSALNGTQNPAEIFEAPVTVTWKLSGLADAADTLLGYYLANTQPAVDLTMTQSVNAILEVHSSQVAFTAAPFKGDKSVIEIDATGTAIANVTDVGASGGKSPIKVTLTNSVDGGYV